MLPRRYRVPGEGPGYSVPQQRSIQSHGVVFCVDNTDGTIISTSDSVQTHLKMTADAVVGQSLSDLFEPAEQIEQLLNEKSWDWPDSPNGWLNPVRLTDRGDSKFAAVSHRTGSHSWIELYPQRSQSSADPVPPTLRNRISYTLPTLNAFPEFATRVVEIFSEVIGYDNVLLYIWDSDITEGNVTESAKSGTMLSEFWFAGGRPVDAARQQHERLGSLVHQIVDVTDQPSALVGSDPDESLEPVDLSLATPTEDQRAFLKAVDYTAAVSIDLRIEGKSWGFLSCYNKQANRISASKLQLCDLLAYVIPVYIERLQKNAQLERAVATESLAYRLEELFQLQDDDRLIELLQTHAEQLMHTLEADALVLKFGTEFVEIGNVPIPPLEFAKLRDKLQDGIATSERLSDILDMNEQQIETSAGGAYMELHPTGDDYVFFVRKEASRMVRWLSDTSGPELAPDIQIGVDSATGTSTAHVKKQSRRFSETDQEVCRIIRRALFASRSRERELDAERGRKAADIDRQRLRTSLSEAVQSNMIGELASALAHELNQPLAAISNYASVLAKQVGDTSAVVSPDHDNYAKTIIEEAERAGELVRRLRGFVEQGNLVPESYALDDVLRQAVSLTTDLLGVEPEQVSLTIEPDLPELLLDRLQIEQVMVNLLRNAFQSMKDDAQAKVTVLAAQDEDWVTVTVRDSGPGIAPDMVEDLFKPFHSSRSGGMGIGLALCNSIITAHGGTIEARNWEHGAEIRFGLPVVPTLNANPRSTS